MPQCKSVAKRAVRRLDIPPRERWVVMPGYSDLLELRWRVRLRRVPAITPEQFAAKKRMVDIEEIVSCSLCGEERFQVLFQPSRRKGRKHWEYLVARCPVCGFLYRQPGIKPERLGDLYATNYSRFLEGKYGDRKRIRRYGLVMDAFDPFYTDGRGRRLFDFGCGNGLFLDTAYERGFDTYGVDLSPDSIEVARTKPSGKNAYFGNPMDVPEIAAGGFDVITLMSVLAHLPCPVEDFRMLHGLLAPGGALMVLTVNANSLYLKRDGNDWSGFTRNHVKFFSPSTLPLLLERAGFGAVVFRPMYGDSVEAGTTALSERNVRLLMHTVDRGNRGNMMRALAFREADGPDRWGLGADAIRL
jgi:SAM-dependent methyltransferase